MWEQANIRWLITRTTQGRLQLGKIFYLYVDGNYVDSRGRVMTPFLLTQINQFWGKYASVTVATFDWNRWTLVYHSYLILSELVDIPAQIQPYATHALSINPTYTFHMHGE
jgi:hypothetical protein